MKQYRTPVLSESFNRGFVVPAAPALLAGLAKGATVGVAAMLGAIGAKKVLGDSVAIDFPALEPCLEA